MGRVREVRSAGDGAACADVPAHRDRARAAGAAVSEVSTRVGQARSYSVDDPEGHRWYFSEPL